RGGQRCAHRCYAAGLVASGSHATRIAPDVYHSLAGAEMLLQPVDVVEAVGDVGVLHQLGEQWDRRLDTVDDELGEAAPEPHQALVAVLPVDDELADQAVVVGRDAVALIDATVDAHAEPAGWVPVGDPA